MGYGTICGSIPRKVRWALSPQEAAKLMKVLAFEIDEDRLREGLRFTFPEAAGVHPPDWVRWMITEFERKYC